MLNRKKGIVVLLIIMAVTVNSLLAACGSNSSKAVNSSESTSEQESTAPVSSKLVDNPRISYLGPEGTYTEEAAQFFFSTGDFQPKETVPDAMADVAEGKADYAVIP